MRSAHAAGLSLLALLASGCLEEKAETGPTGQLAIAVAPLSLEGITNAEYTVWVTNAAADAGGQTVWTRAVSSQQYGDGAGSVSYIGTCDAAAPGGINTVHLTLHALYDGAGLVTPGTYENPTEPDALTREIVCVENADVAVTFDMTIVRDAKQGFFDVAVDFNNIFCSAKLDCEREGGVDLDLLHHNVTGARDMTAVVGLACTGSPTGETFIYLNDLKINCVGGSETFDPIVVDPVGEGRLDTNQAPSANADGYLFGASVFRGVEGFMGKAYWNVSLGLEESRFGAAGDCTLVGRATASPTPFDEDSLGFVLPGDSVYPVVEWNVQLSDASERVCDSHQVNVDGSGVETRYLGYLTGINQFSWQPGPIRFDATFVPGHADGPKAWRVAGASCDPACVHGTCIAFNDCACDPGWDGAEDDNCITPVCSPGCGAHGTCTGPGECTCAPGYWGDHCEIACPTVPHCGAA